MGREDNDRTRNCSRESRRMAVRIHVVRTCTGFITEQARYCTSTYFSGSSQLALPQ